MLVHRLMLRSEQERVMLRDLLKAMEYVGGVDGSGEVHVVLNGIDHTNIQYPDAIRFTSTTPTENGYLYEEWHLPVVPSDYAKELYDPNYYDYDVESVVGMFNRFIAKTIVVKKKHDLVVPEESRLLVAEKLRVMLETLASAGFSYGNIFALYTKYYGYSIVLGESNLLILKGAPDASSVSDDYRLADAICAVYTPIPEFNKAKDVSDEVVEEAAELIEQFIALCTPIK